MAFLRHPLRNIRGKDNPCATLKKKKSKQILKLLHVNYGLQIIDAIETHHSIEKKARFCSASRGEPTLATVSSHPRTQVSSLALLHIQMMSDYI